MARNYAVQRDALLFTFGKRFNRSLEEAEKEAQDFPKPDCKALRVPKLNEQEKEQLQHKGKNPHLC